MKSSLSLRYKAFMHVTHNSSCIPKLLRQLSLLFIALITATNAHAYSFEADGIYYRIVSSPANSVVVTFQTKYQVSYNSYNYKSDYTGDIVIPQTVEYEGTTYTVCGIDDHAFMNSDAGLNSVVMPNTVTYIGSNAFWNDYNLTYIKLSSNLESIGLYGLSTIGVSSIDIPASLKTVQDCAFQGCNNLREVHISDIAAWCDIDFKAYDANPLTSAKQLFINDEPATEIVIPEGVKTVKAYAFAGCENMEKLTIASSVTKCEMYAFYDCKALKDLRIEDSPEQLDLEFSERSIGSSVYLDHAFDDCPLEKIYIGRNCYFNTSPNRQGFTNFKQLKQAEIGSNLTQLTTGYFKGCSALEQITLGNSVSNIGSECFQGCSSLTSISIGSNVSSIAQNAFGDCTALTELIMEDGEQELTLGAGSGSKGMFKDCPIEKVYCGRTLSYQTTAANGYSPFYNNTNIKDFRFGNTVTRIGDYFLAGCTGITDIRLPEGITKIGQQAFLDITGLDTLYIPGSVTSIDRTAFNGSVAKTLVLADDPQPLNFAMSFLSLEKAHIGRSIITNNSVMSLGATLKEATVGPDVELLPSYIFYGSAITEINLPARLKRIENYCFKDCKQLQQIALPDSLTYIGNYCFSECTMLQNITIPASVTEMGYKVFEKCKLNPLGLWNKQTTYNGAYSELTFTGLQKGSVIYAYPTEFDKIRKAGWWDNYNGCPLLDITTPFIVETVEQHLKSVSFTDSISGMYKDSTLVLHNVTFEEEVLTPNEEGIYSLYTQGIYPNYDRRVVYSYSLNGREQTQEVFLHTLMPQAEQYIYPQKTQTYITFYLKATEQEEVEPEDIGVFFNGTRMPAEKQTGYYSVTIPNLIPATSYQFTPYVTYEDETYFSERLEISTYGTNPNIYNGDTTVGPSSVYGKVSYSQGTATITGVTFSNLPDQATVRIKDNEFFITALDPATDYSFDYRVSTQEGSVESRTFHFTTAALQLNTLTPKGVSNTCSIVAAQTNLIDDETNAGFEWIKEDAPASLQPKSANAIIYDGQLEGRIQNLSATNYYKVRPFYKSGTGTTYYGEWITFDPSDFSYFEPTIHTYNQTDIEVNQVTLSAYVLAGTDDIEEQGFELWPLQTKTSRNNQQVIRVQGHGQRMTVSVADLEYGTTYVYRAYVVAAGQTTYSEEQTFTTEYPTAINDVTIAQPTQATQAEIRTLQGDNHLQIRIQGNGQSVSYGVFNISGKCMRTDNVQADGNWQPLPTSNLEPGVYILRTMGWPHNAVKFIVK